MKRELEQLIDNAPPGHFDPKIRARLPSFKRRLSKIADLMDDLGLLDETSQEVGVDENSLRNLVREVSPGSEDAVVEQLRRLPGSNLTKGAKGKKRISWETLSERMVRPLPRPTVKPSPDFTPYSSLEEVRTAVQREAPEIPDSAFAAETLHHRFKAVLAAPGAAGREEAVAAQALPGNVWNCMVQHLGFWGAMVVLAIAVIVLAIVVWILAEIGPFIVIGDAVFWECFWIGFWEAGLAWAIWAGWVATIIVIVHCVTE